MIINPSLPSGHVVFCDDIRQETSGKHTLVGVYGNELGISAPAPITLPQLCAVITLRFAHPVDAIAPMIRISRTDTDEMLFDVKAEIKPIESAEPQGLEQFLEPDSITFVELKINAQMQGVVITQDCAIKVRAFIGEDEIRLGLLQIRFDENQPVTQ